MTRVKACALRIKNGLLQSPTVQVRVSTDKKGLKRINTNRHGPARIKLPSGLENSGECRNKIWFFSKVFGEFNKLCKEMIVIINCQCWMVNR